MSDSQNKTEMDNINDSSFEESTIFSNPTAHRETAANIKKRNNLKVIIAAVLAVTVLAGGAFAVNHFIDPINDGTSSGTSTIEEITLFEAKESEIKSCTITNSYGTYKFINEVTKNGETETYNWYIDGYKKEHLDTTLTSGVISALSKITSTHEVTKRTAEECGFETPQAVATIENSNGEVFTLTIGDTNFEKTGDYIKLSNTDKIYLLSSDVRMAIDVSALSLAVTENTPTFPTANLSSAYKSEEGVLADFDKLVISGKNYDEQIVLEKNHNASTSMAVPYNIVSPIKHYAKNYQGIITLFSSGVKPSGAYAFDTSAQTLKELGLNKPDIQFTMTAEEETATYKLTLQEDGNYAVICDGMTLVAKVSPDDLAFKDFTTTDYYYDWISVLYIDDIKQMIIKTPEKTYDFSIKPDTADESDFVVNYNGTLLDSDNFKNYYGACITLSATDYETQKVSGKPEYTLTYVFNDDVGGRQTIEFFKVSETKYQYRIDGVDCGKVTSADLKKLINNTERVATGLQINNN